MENHKRKKLDLLIRQCTNKSAVHLELTSYEKRGLKNKLTTFLYDLFESGVLRKVEKPKKIVQTRASVKRDQPDEDYKRLKLEVNEIMQNDFTGRIYSQDSLAKINRLKRLENKLSTINP